MQQTSALYKELLETPGCRKEISVEIAGELYGEDRIILLNTYPRLFRSNKMEAGCAVASELHMVIRGHKNIPNAAELIPMYRLRVGDTVSEWIKKGVYYIYTREPNDEVNTLSIVAFDAMVRGDAIWTPDQSLVFPMSMRSAALIIANLMGVEIENPQDISDRYLVDYPANDWTQRNVLQFIAAAHGGNFLMTDLGKLRLLTLNTMPEETNNLVNHFGSVITFGGVAIRV